MIYGTTRRECIYAFRGTDKSVPYIPFKQTDKSEFVGTCFPRKNSVYYYIIAKGGHSMALDPEQFRKKRLEKRQQREAARKKLVMRLVLVGIVLIIAAAILVINLWYLDFGVK